jgi:hypothetical protein
MTGFTFTAVLAATIASVACVAAEMPSPSEKAA